MQFKIRKPAGIQTAAKSVHRWFADTRLLGKGGDTGMNGLIGEGEDHFRHFALGFAKVFQLRLDFSSIFIFNESLISETIPQKGEIVMRFSKNIPFCRKER